MSITKTNFDKLPFELVDMIVEFGDINVYKKLLIYRRFALKTLDPNYNKNFRILFTTCVVKREYGIKYTLYYLNGKLHRDNDLPAVEYNDETKEWHKNGKIHRDNDLPAHIDADGTKEWYKNGLLHRDNGKNTVEYGHNVSVQWVDGFIIKIIA